MEALENQQKYFNYKVQMQRLKKALDNQFYLEALFIEYAILEDRTGSILRYEGNSVKPKNNNGFVSIDKKINKIISVAEKKKGAAHRYFADGIMDELRTWKEERNRLMHALMKQRLTTEELKITADKGNEIVKTVSRKSQNYKKYLERHNMLKDNAGIERK